MRDGCGCFDEAALGSAASSGSASAVALPPMRGLWIGAPLDVRRTIAAGLL